ncbi:MAG: helix-turn-helix transcriptional regulator [Vicinamibacterales bacterium]
MDVTDVEQLSRPPLREAPRQGTTAQVRFLGISERRFHELRRAPGFPAAVVLGVRSVRWLREELADYARSLPRVGVLNEPAQLQARRPR